MAVVLAAALLGALMPAVARQGGAIARTTSTAEDIPVPPAPPGVPAQPQAACTKEQAGAKAEQLLGLLEGLIARDPERARFLLDAFQTEVQRYEQHQADLEEECRAYDALIARSRG